MSAGAAPLGPGREFDAVRALVARWGERCTGIGDDAAVLETTPSGERIVVSTDASVQDVHFRHGWLSPAQIAYRAATAALSDLAAMAARPLGMLVALVLPARWGAALGELGDGLADAAARFGSPILGGDMSRGRDLSIVVTVIGAGERLLRRGGARPGDLVCVTGRLGGPARAVLDLDAGRAPDADAWSRFARPVARLAEARWLAARGATSAIDVSDGLASDLSHVAAASHACIRLELERVPTLPGVVVAAAARSGEEYELVVTLPADVAERVVRGFAQQFDVPLTVVGAVEALRDGRAEVVTTFAGERVDLPAGYDHFSS